MQRKTGNMIGAQFLVPVFLALLFPRTSFQQAQFATDIPPGPIHYRSVSRGRTILDRFTMTNFLSTNKRVSYTEPGPEKHGPFDRFTHAKNLKINGTFLNSLKKNISDQNDKTQMMHQMKYWEKLEKEIQRKNIYHFQNYNDFEKVLRAVNYSRERQRSNNFFQTRKLLQAPPFDPNLSLDDLIKTVTNMAPEKFRDFLATWIQLLSKSAPGELPDLQDILPKVILGIAMATDVSGQCVSHVVQMASGMANTEPWAVQMLDSFGKPTPALLDLNLLWPGAYTECKSVTVPTPDTSEPQTLFSGRYCRARVPLAPPSENSPLALPIGLDIGLCLPDSCSGSDVTLLLNSVFKQLNVSIFVLTTCEGDASPKASNFAIGTTTVIVFAVLLALGTACDITYVQRPKWRRETPAADDRSPSETHPLLSSGGQHKQTDEIGLCTKLLSCFSVYSNGAKLLSTRQQASGSLTCVHGIRFLSMTWIVLGHCFQFPVEIAANFLPYSYETSHRFSFQVVGSATCAVDTFYTISGLLVSYLTLKELKKGNGKLNWAYFYLHRLWRLTPAYMLVIVVYTCLTPFWGSGPLWPEIIPDREYCINNWWTNLLYINNFVRADQLCMGQSWYLSNDMQFYILSPLIFLPLYRRPVMGAVSAAVFLLATTITPAVITVQKQIPPGILAKVDGGIASLSEYVTDYYIKPYNRMAPYVVGMLAGYLMYRTDSKIPTNKIIILSGWLVATCVGLAIVFGLYDASSGNPVSIGVSALYNAVSRPLWALCVSWVILACVSGHGGFVNTILSWPALVPLSRLTYLVYLLHIMVIYLSLYNRDTVFFLSDHNVVLLFLSVVVICYMAAVVASLAFEAPMMALEKVLLHGRGRRNRPQS